MGLVVPNSTYAPQSVPYGLRSSSGHTFETQARCVTLKNMKHIRPHQFFGLYEAPTAERMVQVPLPNRPGLGGLTLLETFIVLAAAKSISAKRIFEFGTFLGRTTLALATNMPEDTHIFTLDLDERQALEIEHNPLEAPITAIHLTALSTLDFDGSEFRHKITTLFGDSTKFDYSPWSRSIDLVFIDGGHEVPTVSSDTKNAIAMMSDKNPSCVLWHDYGNPDYPSFKDYLDNLSETIDIFHIEGTWLCAHFKGLDVAARLFRG
jgi:hypothetical protein